MTALIAHAGGKKMNIEKNFESPVYIFCYFPFWQCQLPDCLLLC